MPRRVPAPSNDVTVYLVLNDYKTGLAYVETAPAEADRETIIRNFLSGQFRTSPSTRPRAGPGTIAGEVLDRAFDADDNLSEGTKRFIDRHVTPRRE
jgi:hypothetical protein